MYGQSSTIFNILLYCSRFSTNINFDSELLSIYLIWSSIKVGYIVTGLKSVREARVGDTIWKAGKVKIDLNEAEALEGYSVVRPFVFAGVF